MIRRFASAKFVPATAGPTAKNPVGSTLFSTPMVAVLRYPGHKILRTSCHESARKRLSGANVRDPERCDHICDQAVTYISLLMKRAADIFPEATSPQGQRASQLH